MRKSIFFVTQSLFAFFCLSALKTISLLAEQMHDNSVGNGNNILSTQSDDQFIITGSTYLQTTINSVSSPLVLPTKSAHKKSFNVFTGLSTSKDYSNSFSFFEVSTKGKSESVFTLHHSKFCVDKSEDKTATLMKVKWVAIEEGTYFSLHEDNSNCLATGTIDLKGPSYQGIIDTSSLTSCSFATSFKDAIIIVQSQIPSSKEGIVSFLATASVNAQNEIEVLVSSLNDESLPETIPVGYLLMPHDYKFSDDRENVVIQGFSIENENSYTVALKGHSNCGSPIALSSPIYVTTKTFLALGISSNDFFSTSNARMENIFFHNKKINCPLVALDTTYPKHSIIVIHNEHGCSIRPASSFGLYDSLSTSKPQEIFNNLTLLWVFMGAVVCVLAISLVLYITYGRKRSRHLIYSGAIEASPHFQPDLMKQSHWMYPQIQNCH